MFTILDKLDLCLICIVATLDSFRLKFRVFKLALIRVALWLVRLGLW